MSRVRNYLALLLMALAAIAAGRTHAASPERAAIGAATGGDSPVCATRIRAVG